MQSLFIQQDHKLLQVLKKCFSELWARNVACPQSMTQKRVKIYKLIFLLEVPILHILSIPPLTSSVQHRLKQNRNSTTLNLDLL